MRKAAPTVLLALALALTACGDADELAGRDAATLNASRADLDDALDTEETLRTSREEAAALRTKVRRIIARGSFENGGKPDEFGLAALGELREIVPSLVFERGDSVAALDQAGTKAFLANAVTDPPAALLPAASAEVHQITEVVGKDDIGPETKIPPARGTSTEQTVSEYLRAAERDIKAVWPRLAAELAKAREEL